jgi:ABC-type spermidine/putrescine transport system permease subunit II
MTEWWTASQAGVMGAILGGGGGTLIGLLGALTGVLAPRGRGRAWIPGMFLVLGVCGALALGAGLGGLALSQPMHVWMILVQMGVIVGGLGFGLGAVVRRVYARMDHRKLDAASLRHGV